MISIKVSGNFDNTLDWLDKLSKKKDIYSIIDKHAKNGVAALSSATPVNTGVTASSWGYDIIQKDDNYQLVFKNSNVSDGIPVVILIRYGHATKNGGYISGNDFLSPVVNDIFNDMAESIWKEVTDK